MEQERRRTPRYPFAGSIEMREGASEDKRTARVGVSPRRGLRLNKNSLPDLLKACHKTSAPVSTGVNGEEALQNLRCPPEDRVS